MTSDDPVASALAAEIIRRVNETGEEAYTTDAHIHAVAYVLASRSLYGLSHAEIRDRLSNKQACLAAFEVFAAFPQLDFADALAVASMRGKGITEIYSFDRDLDRVQEVKRSER